MTLIVTDGDFIYEDRQASGSGYAFTTPSKLFRINKNVIIGCSGPFRNSAELSLFKRIPEHIWENPESDKHIKAAFDQLGEMLGNLTTVEDSKREGQAIMIVAPKHVIVVHGRKLEFRKIILRSECAKSPIASIGSGVATYRALFNGDARAAFMDTLRITNTCGHGANIVDIRDMVLTEEDAE